MELPLAFINADEWTIKGEILRQSIRRNKNLFDELILQQLVIVPFLIEKAKTRVFYNQLKTLNLPESNKERSKLTQKLWFRREK